MPQSREERLASVREAVRRHYQRERASILARKARHYHYQTECRRLASILLDG